MSCIEKLLALERGNKGEEGVTPRKGSKEVVLPPGFRDQLYSIYEMCLDHRPLNVVTFIAKKLESRLNRRILNEDQILRCEAAGRDDSNAPKSRTKKKVSETEESKTVTVEMLMDAYYNREPRGSQLIQEWVNFNISEAMQQANGRKGSKKKKPCFKPPRMLVHLGGHPVSISKLAWLANGERSIYDPELSPFENFCRANPHIVSHINFKCDKNKSGEVHSLDKTPDAQSLSKTNSRETDSKGKATGPVPIIIEVKEVPSADRSNVVSQKERNPDVANLCALLKFYSQPSDLVNKYPEPCEVDVWEENAIASVDTSTQTTFFTSPNAIYNLMHNVQFVSPTCLSMTDKGLPLNWPSWSDPSSHYRPVISLDWNEFFHPVERSAGHETERIWLGEEEFINDTSYGLQESSYVSEDEKIFKFNVDVGSSDPSLYIPPSSPDVLPPSVYYSPSTKRYEIRKQERLRTYRWEAKAKFLKQDRPDDLSPETSIGLQTGQKESIAKWAAVDKVEELPITSLPEPVAKVSGVEV